MASTATIRHALALLEERSFLRLFAARLVSMFGSSMAPIAIAFGVLDLTDSPAHVGLVVACDTLSRVAMLMFGGAVADRTSRRRVMVRADLFAALSQAGMAALFLTGNAEIALFCALAAINGATNAFHGPATDGLIPQIVAGERLQSANALLGLARNGSMALGAAAAGVLVAYAGAGWALAVDAGTFVLSAVLVWPIAVPAQKPLAKASLFDDLRDGWSEFMRHTWLWTIVAQFSVMVAGSSPVFAVIGPTVAKQAMGGAADWGLIASSFGVGTLTGGFVAMHLAVRRPMLVATLLVFSNALPGLLLIPPCAAPVICLGAFVDGVCGQIFAVLWYTTLQKRVALESLSRVSAYDHLGSTMFAPIGVVAAGWLLESVGARPTLMISTAMIVVPTLVVLCVREVRTLEA